MLLIVIVLVENTQESPEHTQRARGYSFPSIGQGLAERRTEALRGAALFTFVNIAKLNSYFGIAKTARHSPAEPPNATGGQFTRR